MNNIIKVAAILLLLLFVWTKYEQWRSDVANEKLVKELADSKTNDSTAFYKTKFNQQVATSNSLVLQRQKDFANLLTKNDSLLQVLKHFRRVDNAATITDNAHIHDTIAIPFETKIPCVFKPFQVVKNTPHYSILCTISNNSMLVNSIDLPNTVSVVFGAKPSGFLGMNNTCTVDVINSNPYVKTNDVRGYSFQPRKRWYQTFGAHVAFGAAATLIGREYLQKNFIR